MSSITVLVRNASHMSRRQHLDGSRFLIGREEGDIILGDPQVSWRHGEFVFDGTVREVCRYVSMWGHMQSFSKGVGRRRG